LGAPFALKRQRRLSCTVWARLGGRVGRLDRAAGLLEDRHQPVAEALDDLAAARADLRLDGRADLAQERHRLGVADVERPGGEVREVGEHDRQLAVAAAAALRLERPCHTCSALIPASRSAPGCSAVRAERRRPSTAGAWSPVSESGSP
jgi:hypothetical protein